jgi:hypothetical protein
MATLHIGPSFWRGPLLPLLDRFWRNLSLRDRYDGLEKSLSPRPQNGSEEISLRNLKEHLRAYEDLRQRAAFREARKLVYSNVEPKASPFFS